MAKQPNIIQRRELEPLLLKAEKCARNYEIVANCTACVINPDSTICSEEISDVCRQCKRNSRLMPGGCCIHSEAVRETMETRGTLKYCCQQGYIFWTSPFFSGERFAGAFLCGGIDSQIYNQTKINSLINIISMISEKLSKYESISSFYINKKSVYNDSSNTEKENKVKIRNSIYTLDMERKLLANLRRGDIKEAKSNLSVLLITHFQESGLNFEAFKLKAIEIAVILSRAAYELNTAADNTILEINSRCIKKIKESSQFDEINQILCVITDNVQEKIFSFHGMRHFSALRRAERFIWENYTRKLSLAEIANASGLSAPYFSTIFKEEMGENLSNYLNKLRVEKAKDLLVSTIMPISEISTTCGFEDQSWFSKIFKNNTGLTPGKYRENRYGG